MKNSTEVRIDYTEFEYKEEPSHDLLLPKMNTKQYSVPIDESAEYFMSPENRRSILNKLERNESENKTKQEYLSSLGKLDINKKKKLERDFYGIEYLVVKVQEDSAKYERISMSTAKVQQEIIKLKFTSEVNEFNVSDSLLKLIINERLTELLECLDTMKLMLDSDHPFRHESNTNVVRETGINTSLNPSIPLGDDNVKEKHKSEVEYKHTIMLCFWLALHLERLSIVREIAKLDPIMNKICVNLIK